MRRARGRHRALARVPPPASPPVGELVLCTQHGFGNRIRSVVELASSAGLAHVPPALAREPLAPLAALLASSGRPAALSRLKALGVPTLGERQALVNALQRATREGRLTREGELPPDFEASLEQMPAIVRSVLVDGALAEPAELVGALRSAAAAAPCRNADVSGGGPAEGRILRVPSLLSVSNCAALRRAVDAERSVAKDSIDRRAEHQLNLTRDALEALVGAGSAAAIDELPRRLREVEDGARAREGGGAAAPDEFVRVDYFVRRFTRDTRPWVPFHTDTAAVTVNVALADDAEHGGGRLLAVAEGRVQPIERRVGEATVHSSALMHAVTAMRRGVRYSLIAFFHTAATARPPASVPSA